MNFLSLARLLNNRAQFSQFASVLPIAEARRENFLFVSCIVYRDSMA
jgi:hypothetical protein